MNQNTMKAGWPNFADIYSSLRSPLRPSECDVTITRTAISGKDGHVLLLGTTPEISVLGNRLIAVEGSIQMISQNWTGKDKKRSAICGNWYTLPMATSSIEAVIGDGSLNSVTNIAALLKEIERVLMPGGVGVFRAFCSPEISEKLDDIRQDIEDNRPGNFHALKWRIAMSLAAETIDWQVPVSDIRLAFNRMFPDRQRLQDIMQWSNADIATIDYYEHAEHSLTFPSLRRFCHMISELFPSVQVFAPEGYPLAERCPTVVLAK